MAGVYESGANPASSTSMVMPCRGCRNGWGRRAGSTPSSSPTKGRPSRAPQALPPPRSPQPLLEENDLQAEPVKKEAIDQADQGGETFTSIFLLFGQFSVGAGALDLLDLRHARRGAQARARYSARRRDAQGHLMRMFAFEGRSTPCSRAPSVASPASG